jgi:bifunctional UDP-N-acetylglucosamine pyrophosphorylase/glucosamine-1-phosphate N-acetyltransferase
MSTTVAPAAAPAAVVVLAAGGGTRMRSDLPKPLHRIGGASLLRHVLDAAAALSPARLAVVVGHGGPAVAEAARALRPGATIVEQPVRRGTGDAVRCALDALGPLAGDLLVLYADTPFVRPATLARLLDARAAGAAVAVLGFEPAEPGGYGRLILGPDGGLDRIVEAADATPAERAVRLCNSGVMALDAARAPGWIAGLSAANAKGEIYLTDVVAAARAQGAPCAAETCDAAETLGVNDRADLAAAEAAFQVRARAAAMAGGATLVAPETVFLAFDTALGRDATVEPFVVFGPGVTVEDGVRVGAFSRLEGCAVRAGAEVGPYARLRPGAEIGPGARVGNFVEVKNAVLGAGAKAGHLAYVGDADVGAGANLGAGTIFCNYDGVAKHRTAIGPGAFVGSNAALVAPLRIGADAYVASGSVVTEDAPEGALVIGRARQTTKPGLGARLKARLAAMAAKR